MPETTTQPIIIKKKVSGHGHHGGAWKVAYADFVTAMMAFFMVMWLMNSGEKVKEAVGAYFRDPKGAGKMTGSAMTGSGQGIEVNKDNMAQLKDQLNNAMKTMPAFQALKDNVTMTVTGEGLRIELLETEKGLFFESGRADPSSNGQGLLVMMTQELAKLPNNVLIEGHTDAKPFSSRDGYSNWELSVDRANEARKIMEANGLRQGQVVQVRGFADRRLRLPDDPHDPSNRRISVIVQYLDPPPGAKKAEATAEGGGHGEAKGGHGEAKGGHGEAPKAEEKKAEPAKEAPKGHH
jgi:chemotaxis protein MotB